MPIDADTQAELTAMKAELTAMKAELTGVKLEMAKIHLTIHGAEGVDGIAQQLQAVRKEQAEQRSLLSRGLGAVALCVFATPIILHFI